MRKNNTHVRIDLSNGPSSKRMVLATLFRRWPGMIRSLGRPRQALRLHPQQLLAYAAIRTLAFALFLLSEFR